MTDIKAKMKADAKRAKQMAKEVVATLEFYSKKAWKALKNPLMSLSVSAILSSCGIVGNSGDNRLNNADLELNKNNTEQVAQKQPQKDSPKENPYEYGYSDPNEVVETPEEKEAREIEEEFERIRGGEYTHGDAGTDKADYGKPGDNGHRYTQEELDEMRNIYSNVGRGVDDVELSEMDKELGRKSDTSDSRDMSWIKAVRDSGRGR